MFTYKTGGSLAVAASHVTEANLVLISAPEYIFGLNNMTGDPFSPGEEREGNT